MGDNNGEGIEVKVSSQMNTTAQQVKTLLNHLKVQDTH